MHGDVLGSQPDAIEQVRNGGLQAGQFRLGLMGPFIFNDVPHMFRAMDGGVGKIFEEAMAVEGVVPLAWYDSGARSFYNSERPIRTPANVDGLKVRVMNNDLFVDMIAQLGGNATPMAFGEVYQSPKSGAIDSAENNWGNITAEGRRV